MARNIASLEQISVKILHNPQARSKWSNGGSNSLWGGEGGVELTLMK